MQWQFSSANIYRRLRTHSWKSSVDIYSGNLVIKNNLIIEFQITVDTYGYLIPGANRAAAIV